jgi:hypothetical protein
MVLFLVALTLTGALPGNKHNLQDLRGTSWYASKCRCLAKRKHAACNEVCQALGETIMVMIT